ncbi:HAD family hydrolase [Gimesia algae]|uniref:Haloacid dehalogenase-like hydrolase n=1 Tax=Gimesia algae TaxID=2527971 RepID=A0A517VLK6_9PLAN|nr:hypothetical protein [Gimesia algae]QDT93845.1 hypothetical protein Pan161_55320 [Gimesia algae]
MTSAPEPDHTVDAASSRRNFLTATAGIAAGLLPATLSAEEPTMPSVSTRPKCLFFDVNETLLDLDAMKESVAAALGGRPDLLPLWFTTMLQYSLVATVGDHYDDFGVIGAATLQMVARNHDIDLSDDAAKQALAPIRSLPAHPDVRPALEWRLACKADPLWGSYWRVKWTHRSKFLILEAFDLQFRGEGCLRWTITDVYGVLIATG